MSNKLLSNTYKLLFLLLISAPGFAQVGIGTTTPKAFFNVADNKDVLFGNDVSGEGNKLIWYASKAAFRAGYVTDAQWNSNQVGIHSFAAGFNTIASGPGSTALGARATSAGAGSMAIGYTTYSGGHYSTAMGNNVSTGSKTGSFIIGDYTGTAIIAGDQNRVFFNTADNQMVMRFEGGYLLYSSAPNVQATAVGVKLAPNANAWQTLSDSTRKENFRPADGAAFLDKISQMRLGSWNYKGQDAKQYRHYGPMAQDFFAAFGRDGVGTIGEDKSINQADFDGVNLIAIQSLIKEVNQLKVDNQALRTELADAKRNETTQARLDKIEALLSDRPADATLTFKP